MGTWRTWTKVHSFRSAVAKWKSYGDFKTFRILFLESYIIGFTQINCFKCFIIGIDDSSRKYFSFHASFYDSRTLQLPEHVFNHIAARHIFMFTYKH